MDLILHGNSMKRLIVVLIIFVAFPLYAQETTLPFESQNLLAAGNGFHFKTDTSKQAPFQKKSPGIALLMSLILPGSGEYYAGSKQYTAWFVAAEALLWIGMYANDAYAANLTDEYKSFAAMHAGVQTSGKDWQYWTNIGKYDDIYTYNDQRLRQRLFDDVYEENQANYWMWNSHKHRITYDSKRITANEVAARVIYFQAAIGLNHLISGIHAMYRARMHNKNRDSRTAWNLQFDSVPQGRSYSAYGARLTIRF